MKKQMMAWVLMPLMALANDSFTCSVSIDDATAGSAVRKGTASWKNTGSAGMNAPYVRVSAGEGVRLRLTDSDAWGKAIEFLAASSTSPVSLLKANESGSQTFFCQTDSDDGVVELSWTTESNAEFPWSDIGSSLKPSHVSNDAWAFALSTLKSRLGTTWDSYLNRLRSNMDDLAENGRSVNRVDRLLQIEIDHALGVDSVLPVLVSVTDAARSARGLGLSFTRSYSSSMYGRFTKGMLGYGWTDNLSTYAELTDAATLVFRIPGGGSYAFSKLNGAWVPEDPRDKTVLTETPSAYKLSGQDGAVMTFAKSNMRTSSIADNSGNALTFTWNGTTLKKITHTDGQSLSFGYSGGLLASVTDDCGRTTQYSYSSSILKSVTSSDGFATKYEYRFADSTAAARALSRIVYPDGTTREFSYDASSGLVSAISVNDGRERTAIVRDGLQTTVTGPDGAETGISSGVSGEVLETVDALGGVSSQRYTADGLLAAIISPSGLEGKIAHDAQGRVSKSVSPAGHETSFAYEDTFGNLTAVTDAKKQTVTYGYDAKGRGTSVAFADGSVSKLEYNDRGDVVKATNRRGQTIAYAYDSRGRVTKKTWSTGRTFTYAYDAHGNVTEASDSETGTVTMEYDVADRLTRIVYPKGRGFTFAYDAAGRLVTRTSLDGVVERFAYDTAGRLASVSDGNGTVYLMNTYDATTGRLARQENGNGTSVAYLYDKLGRVVSIEHSDASGKIAESLQYCYDADGRCLRASSLQGEERYTYDKDGQLTAVDYPEIPDETFAYDAVGNRTTANGETYTVNGLNQYTAVSDGRTFSYDKDGNLTKMTDASGTTTYTYDTLNRLTAVKNASAGIDWSCQYDVFGNRTSVTDHGVTTERVYLQGTLPSVAAEYVNGELKERHILVGAVRVADLKGEAASSPLVVNGSVRYYHADLIGSTRLVTDDAGSVVDRCAYTAFGEHRTGEMNDSAAGYVGTLGVETDPTGLLFMRNRYYSPTLGRFIQMDPIGVNGEDVNLYRYADNQPIRNIDPEGFVSWNSAVGAISGVAGFGVGKNQTLSDYGAGLAINSLYGDGVHNVRIIGGGGLTLSAANKSARYLEYGGKIVGKTAKTVGGIVSIYSIFQDFNSDNYTGLALDVAGLIPNPWIKAGVLAWNVGYLLGELAFDLFGDKGGQVNTAMIRDINKKVVVQMPFDFEYSVNIGDDPAPGPGPRRDDPAPGPGPRRDDPTPGPDDEDDPMPGPDDDDEPTPSPDDEADPINVGSFTVTAVGGEVAVWSTASRSMTVSGSFRATFSMCIDCELMTGAANFQMFVDGVQRAGTHSLPVWLDFDIEVQGEGVHTLEWVVNVIPATKNGATATGSVANMKIFKTSKKMSKALAACMASETSRAPRALSSVTGSGKSSRLYSYERYVVVKGVPYSFALSADGDSAVSVSGLPAGFAFANGQIKGTAAGIGETEIAITVGGMRKEVPFVVIDAPEKFAAIRCFRVVFDGNGGMVSENLRDVMVNANVGDLPVPTREEYDFVGWFTAKDGGTKISATTKVTADVVYYAHWTARMTSVYPELASVSLNKTQLGISDSLAVTFRIANPATSISSEEDNLDLYIDGVLTLGRHLDKMRSSGGLTSTIYVYSATMGVGTHTIVVKLRNGKGSFSNSVTVVNDKTADSRMDWAFHKLKSSEPDSFYLGSSLNDMSGRTSFTVGQGIFVEVHFWNANKVRNLDPVHVKLDLSTGASTSFTWNSMDPGVTGYLSDDVRMPAMLQNLPVGSYTLTATIDPYNNWWETDENNNVKRINFTVVAASVPHVPTHTESRYLYEGSEAAVAVDKGEVAPYAAGAAVYDGFVVQDGAVKGTIQVKVAKMKNGEAKVTATVQLADGSKKISFKNGVADEYGNVTGLTAAGHALSISLGVNGMAGTMDGKSVDGARNVFSAKDADSKATAAAIEKQWVGAVNVVGDGVVLSVTVAKKGKVKVSGAVDGVKVSATSQLLVGETDCCIPVVITKKAKVAFNLWLGADGSVEVAGLAGATAGKAGTLKSGAAFRMDGAALARVLPGLLTDYLPGGLSVAQSGAKWVVAGGAKAGSLKLLRGTSEIDREKSKFTDNMSGLKLTYKAKDGSFKGSFKAYALENGKIKSYTVNVTGVMVGDKGYGTATLKKPAVSFPVTIE